MVSHPELGSDPSIGSDRESGRDKDYLLSTFISDRGPIRYKDS